ncbi:MAG: hypothetical protein Hyperionvirus30_19 [Hyperionvirus sp.]|uniref:PPM-type phosphatase domain-containing protein n=1 Tax=Hyperionvirus sp. TaxID=2487770 RepID=A0A3G5AFE4_9VIRU|nr:MAG: hypothetical protein Hyperionvirus30_19 [Hyperionvirus sp.]
MGDEEKSVVGIGVVEQGIRDECEDFIVRVRYGKGWLFGVFDGHAGKAVSQFCAEKLVECLDEIGGEDWNEKLAKVFVVLQERICLDVAIINEGTTAVIGFVGEDMKIYIGVVGDARAMIVDVVGNEVMNVGGGVAVVKDMMGEEFKKHGIREDCKLEKYITRTQFYDGVRYCPEWEYYRQVLKMSFKKIDGAFYIQAGIQQLQPLRALGDKNATGLIRVPELYSWVLTGEQLRRGKLVFTSDGLENHKAVMPEKLAKMLVSPFDTLFEVKELFRGTCLDIDKSKYVREGKIDVVMDPKWERGVKVKKVLEIFAGLVKAVECDIRKYDKEWASKLMLYYPKFVSAVMRGENTLELIVFLAIMLISDDNISIIAFDLGR